MKNKLLLFIFLCSSYSTYTVEVKNSRWSFLFPKIMKDTNLNINSYTHLKVATYLYLGMQLGKWTNASSAIWANRLEKIFNENSLVYCTILRGIYHGKTNRVNCATFKDSFNYMMYQDRLYKRGESSVFCSTKQNFGRRRRAH